MNDTCLHTAHAHTQTHTQTHTYAHTCHKRRVVEHLANQFNNNINEQRLKAFCLNCAPDWNIICIDCGKDKPTQLCVLYLDSTVRIHFDWG